MDVSTNALRTTDRPDHQIDLLIAALQQLRAGFTPIPVNNKVSLVEWKQYQHSRPDLNTVVRWFTGTKPTGMALVTGAKTGLVCIDIDPGGRKTINALKLHLPTTVSEQTPRGWHLYFKHPGPEWEVRGLTSECIGLPGVDIRGDGNYSVCAPSEGYEWADNLSFAEMEPAEMPKWLWELKDRQGEPVVRQRRGAPRQAVAVAERNVGQEEYTLLVPSPSVPPKPPTRRSGPSDLSAAHPQSHNMKSASSSPLGDLAALATVPEVAFAVMGLVGREVTRIGKAFCCPLPGHEERKPSAALWQRPGEPIMLIDFHMRPQQPDSAEYAAANPDIDQEAVTAPQMHWMLPDVYAACKTGKARKLTKGQRALWWLRCLAELGIVKPPPQMTPKLPADAPEEAQKVFAGFTEALSLRTHYDSTQKSMPFSYRFADGWCGLSWRKVRDGMRWLMERGYLKVVGTSGDGATKCSLYAIGRPHEDH